MTKMLRNSSCNLILIDIPSKYCPNHQSRICLVFGHDIVQRPLASNGHVVVSSGRIVSEACAL